MLAAAPGDLLSDAAARVALAALNVAARGAAHGPTRTGLPGGRRGQRDGLACTLLYVGADTTGLVQADTWRVLLPGRVPLFHAPGTAPRVPSALRVLPEPANANRIELRLVEGVA